MRGKNKCILIYVWDEVLKKLIVTNTFGKFCIKSASVGGPHYFFSLFLSKNLVEIGRSN